MKLIAFLLCLIIGLSSHSAATLSTIAKIQGTSTASPLVGQRLTVKGIVTLVSPATKGFFLQSDIADDDPRTSEGIFVYTGNTPVTVRLGDYVAVTGKVTEFDQQTQLVNASIATLGRRPLPAAVALPALSEAESVESMRVLASGQISNLNQLLRYGSAELDNGYWLDDGQFDTYPSLNTWQQNIRLSQTLQPSTAVVVHRFGQYGLFAEQVNLTGNPRPTPPERPADGIRIVASNLYNFFNGNHGDFSQSRGPRNDQQWQRQLAKTVAAIEAMQPDVLLVSEVENDLGQPNSAINALAAKTGLTVLADDQPLGHDAIAVAILYRAERLQAVEGPMILHTMPRANRMPVAQQFVTPSGTSFLVSPQHWKSKRCTTSDCGLSARLAAAEAVDEWLAGYNNVVVAGDLNSYYQDPAWQAMTRFGWQSQLASSAYTYRYQGQYGALDHVFTRNMIDWQLRTQVWHINVDEAPGRNYRSRHAPLDASRYSDHDPIIVDLLPR